MSETETVLYAGYGANRDIHMMESIIGDTPEILGAVVIKDVELCVQRLDQISDSVASPAPARISPKQIMIEAWGDGSNFETYAVRPRAGSLVSGNLFGITQSQRDLVAEWELIKFGWYDYMSVAVQLDNRVELRAETEGFASGQDIDRVVDGQSYETFLVSPSLMFAAAERARLDYLKQLNQ